MTQSQQPELIDSKPLQSVNPATNDVVATFSEHDDGEVEQALSQVSDAQRAWRSSRISERSTAVRSLAERLRSQVDDLARLAAIEMGKPIRQGEREVEKCAEACDYFAASAERFLAPEVISAQWPKRTVQFEPLGVVLAIMPWNFPFWQVFRLLAPAFMAGNGVLLKHASNVPQCALAIENVIEESDLPSGLMRTVLARSSRAEELIADERIRAVSLTGSTEAGRKIASVAGSHLRKQVLELGGSDPFIVLEDADPGSTAKQGAIARTLNGGQSCVAAKRFILETPISEEFTTKLRTAMEDLKVGDPLDRQTDVGPLARPDLVEDLQRQVERSLEMGAKLSLGGKPSEGLGNFYPPTLLTDVTPDMPVFAEETFGPVAALTVAQGDNAIVSLANQSAFALGASIWTRDHERASLLASRIDAGAVFVNQRVSSDPSLPFGGTKDSGYGRELGSFGLRELTNIKAVVSS